MLQDAWLDLWWMSLNGEGEHLSARLVGPAGALQLL